MNGGIFIINKDSLNELILNSVKDGIYGMDINGNTTFVNPSACEMVGYQQEEIIGKYQHSLIHHTHADGMLYKPEDCPIYDAVYSGKTTYVRENVFWRKDRSSFPVEYISAPIKEGDQIIGSVITFRDISEKKKMEELMIKSEKLSLAKPNLANYEYTDIRQLINGVVSLLDTKAFRKSIHIEVDIQNER